MRILLYNPDNGVTRNFMPHLWMFLLQSLTPPGHEVVLIDGNAKAMSREELVDFCKNENIGLVGIGSIQSANSSYYDLHPTPNPDSELVARSGAAGEFLAHLIRDDGSMADYPLNLHLVALEPEELAKILLKLANGLDENGEPRQQAAAAEPAPATPEEAAPVQE